MSLLSLSLIKFKISSKKAGLKDGLNLAMNFSFALREPANRIAYEETFCRFSNKLAIKADELIDLVIAPTKKKDLLSLSNNDNNKHNNKRRGSQTLVDKDCYKSIKNFFFIISFFLCNS